MKGKNKVLIMGAFLNKTWDTIPGWMAFGLVIIIGQLAGFTAVALIVYIISFL